MNHTQIINKLMLNPQMFHCQCQGCYNLKASSIDWFEQLYRGKIKPQESYSKKAVTFPCNHGKHDRLCTTAHYLSKVWCESHSSLSGESAPQAQYQIPSLCKCLPFYLFLLIFSVKILQKLLTSTMISVITATTLMHLLMTDPERV